MKNSHSVTSPVQTPKAPSGREGRKGKPQNCSALGPMQGRPGWGGRNRVPPVVHGKLTQLASEVQVNGEVQVTIILGSGLCANGAKDLLPSLHCQVDFHVEHCLLPAYLQGLGAGEACPLAAVRELDVEVNQSTFHLTCRQKGDVESQVFCLDSVDVHLLYKVGLGDQLLGAVHHIYQGLPDGHIFDARYVKAIYILPPVAFVIFVLPVFNGCHI